MFKIIEIYLKHLVHETLKFEGERSFYFFFNAFAYFQF